MQAKPRTRVTTWMAQAQKKGIISNYYFNKFLEDNEKKEEFLEKYNLPKYKTFGIAKNTKDLEEIIPQEYKQARFWIRLMNETEVNKNEKKYKTSDFNLSYNTLVNIVEENNSVYQIIEYKDSDYSGTIIAKKGHISQECWIGEHRNSEEVIEKETFSQKINFELHFNYSKNCTDFEKKLMLNSLKFFSETISRTSLEKLQIYSEWAYNKKDGYIFIDGSEHEFWVNP